MARQPKPKETPEPRPVTVQNYALTNHLRAMKDGTEKRLMDDCALDNTDMKKGVNDDE